MEIRSESEVHEQAALNIPWLVNDTLDAASAQALRAHLSVCESCREDYETQRQVFQGMQADDQLLFAAEPSFTKLVARLEALEAAADIDTAPDARAAEPENPVQAGSTDRAPPGRSRRRRSSGHPPVAGWTAYGRFGSRTLRFLAAAMILETVGLGILLASYPGDRIPGRAAAPANYVTLSERAAAAGKGARIRVVFRGGMSIDRLAELLRPLGAHVIDGPSDSNVYTLGFAAPLDPHGQAYMQRIATLRADPEVMFAEPAADSGISP